MSTLHTSVQAPPDPDVACCLAAAMTSGQECSCWMPVRSEIRALPKEGPSEVRARMCGDCAYRGGSPERAGRAGEPLDYGRREPFFCHQGVAYVVALVHPCGAVISGEKGDYDPILAADRIFQADGTPGVLCAGWAAANHLPRGTRR